MTDHLPGWDKTEIVSLADCKVQGGRPGNRVAICEQGSEEWLVLRRGCLTASNAAKVIGIKGEASKSTTRETYLYELVAERITGSCAEHHVTWAMQRGTEQEPAAREWYAQNVRPVTEVGFVFLDTDAREIGASPDGLCEDRGLELKVPLPHTHCQLLHKINTAKDPAKAIPTGYRLQMQFGMWCTGLALWDFLIWQPDSLHLPNKIVTVHADEKLHAAFDTVLPEFVAEVSEAVKAIKAT